jgi:hypothetical protein
VAVHGLDLQLFEEAIDYQNPSMLDSGVGCLHGRFLAFASTTANWWATVQVMN